METDHQVVAVRSKLCVQIIGAVLYMSLYTINIFRGFDIDDIYALYYMRI